MQQSGNVEKAGCVHQQIEPTKLGGYQICRGLKDKCEG